MKFKVKSYIKETEETAASQSEANPSQRSLKFLMETVDLNVCSSTINALLTYKMRFFRLL